MSSAYIAQMTPMNTEHERLSDVLKLSAHVTRVLGQNPGFMTLQGTNTYLLQPPSNNMAPLILIDTSSPHTAQQYVDCLFTYLFHLGLESGNRETHFESYYAAQSLKNWPEEERDAVKAKVVGMRREDPSTQELHRTEYGTYGRWAPSAKKERRLPPIEHIILTHRHLDHVGALPLLLKTLQEHGCPPPKLWKLPSPDEAELAASPDARDRATSDAALWATLTPGTFTPLSPLQPFHPVMPGLMISIIDPVYRHLLKHDEAGKPKWNEVPEIARVSLRCLKTPGHTADSISLVLCEGEKGVFTGDTVLGQGTTVFTDLAAYMSSLKTLLALKPSVLYPAHGPHITDREAVTRHLTEYITHRQQREDQLVKLLQDLAANPTTLRERMADLHEKVFQASVAEDKYNHEFFSGKPYHPKITEKDKDGKDVQISDEKLAKMREEEAVERRAAVLAKYPLSSSSASMALICRLLYQSDKETLVNSAAKSIGAHLRKLESEGKVKKVKTRLPKVTEGQISEDLEDVDAWQWAGELGSGEAEAKPNTE